MSPPQTPEEQEDYDQLYTASWRLAVSRAQRVLGDPALAEDAAQVAFLRIWSNWSTVAPLPPEARRSYLILAAKNAATDELRHRHAHPGGSPLSLDYRLHPAASDHASSGASERETLRLSGMLVDPDPSADPERMALARELLAELVEQAGGGALRRFELLLLAAGYGPKETARILRQLALKYPRDPGVEHYRNATSSSVKMRRSRHRARLARLERRAQQAEAQVTQVTQGATEAEEEEVRDA